MKFVDAFGSFLLVEVNLNQGRLDTLQERVDAIESFLEGHPTFEPIFLDLIPAGSWAHRTIIKPVREHDEFDADVLLHVEEQPGWQPQDYIEALFAAFRASGRYNAIVERKTRCVRVNYAGDFHLDVVPYLEQGGLHYITNRLAPPSTGGLEASNPEAFTAWIDERQRVTNATFIKAVRLIKYLRDFKDTFTCKSIILLTLLGQLVNEIEASYYPQLYADVPSTLNTLLRKLADSLPEEIPEIFDPAGTGDNFSQRYREGWNYPNFRDQIRRYADKVQDAYEDADPARSVAKWQDILGPQFRPAALVPVETLAPLSTEVPASSEKFIDQPPFNLPIQLDPSYRVRIRSRCTGLRTGKSTRRRGFLEFDLSAKGNRVPKQRSLVFKASVRGPAPYDALYWKVRNGGTEAAQAGQLRGEITPDEGKSQKKESSLYKGSHYVECYVAKNGVVVAKDRHQVIVT